MFTFLNILLKTSSPFGGIQRGSEENEKKFGKLWFYNLNYMDYLLQPNMDKETGISLINHFIKSLPTNPTAIEPYPVALRGINYIKFLSKYEFAREYEERRRPKQSHDLNSINSSLYAQYQILLDNLEYHLLANHLLEDGFSLLFGAYYFKDIKLYAKAKEIIKSELDEQILEDGAHFELSPMYHQIILDRLLDCINLVQNNRLFESQSKLLELMRLKASVMLNWLNNITFSNGEIPLLNDSAPDIAPKTKQLFDYASSLNFSLETFNSKLSSSGYRKYDGENYECIVDIGQIGPLYQPGHAHADTFNFVLNINNLAFLVDTGISTYEANLVRLKERGTETHNTVTIGETNSSEVWSSFRIAKRAKVEIFNEDVNSVCAQHYGYRKIKTTHQRVWQFNENNIAIIDKIIGKQKNATAHLHFAPGLILKKTKNGIHANNSLINFAGADKIDLQENKIPNGYNRFLNNYKVQISFSGKLETYITIQ